MVGLRNSQRPEVALMLPKAAWHALLDGIVAGEFD